MPERRVYFYRAYCGRDESHRPLSFDTDSAVGTLGGLGFDEGDGPAYLDAGDGDRYFCQVDSSRTPHRVRITRSRRQHLPPVEQAGRLNDLELDEDAGLAEESFVSFFEAGIVGCIFSGYSPRVSVLRRLIREKCGDPFQSLDFAPLIRQDVAEALDDLEEIRVLDLRIDPSYAEQVAQASESLSRSITGLGELSAARQVSIVLQPEPYKREWLARDLLRIAKRLIGLRGITDGLTRYRVKGRRRSTGRLDEIDLLREKLMVSREVAWEDDRSARLYAPSAYSQITAAYDELRDDLEAAAQAM